MRNIEKRKYVRNVNKISNDDIYTSIEDQIDTDKYLTDLISTTIDDRVLDEIDESEIPKAANFAEFCYSTSFNNYPAFPRCLQFACHFFGEICPWCSDPAWEYNLYDQEFGEINEHVIFTRYGVCPKCGRTQYDFVKYRKWNFPNRFLAIIGQRAGKNIMAVQMWQYHIHRLLTLELKGKRVNPFIYYNTRSPLAITFTSVTLTQAMKNVWKPFKVSFESSPWFKEYLKFLDYHGKKKGVQLYHNNETFLDFRNKNLYVSCSAPDMRSLRGATRAGSTIDEICLMDAGVTDAKTKSNRVLGTAHDIWISLSNSLKTVRKKAWDRFKNGELNVPTGFTLDVSSPCHANDKGMQDLRESQTNPFIDAHNCATWEFNPDYTKADFDEDYASDPAEADRNFGAVPPLTIDPWINPEDRGSIIVSCRDTRGKPMLSVTKMSEKNPFGEESIWLHLDGVFDASTPILVGIDNGLSNNAFALVIVSVKDNKPYVEECFVCKPNQAEHIKVNLDKMFEDFVYPLASRTNCVAGFYDHWASSQHIMRFRDEGKDWRQYAPKPTDFDMLKSRLMSSDISLPFSEYDPNVFINSKFGSIDLVRQSWSKPNFGLLLQIFSVRKLGNRLYKPLPPGDDDIFRAFCLPIIHLYNDEELRKRMNIKAHIAMNNSSSNQSCGVIASRNFSSGSMGGIAGGSSTENNCMAVSKNRCI